MDEITKQGLSFEDTMIAMLEYAGTVSLPKIKLIKRFKGKNDKQRRR